MKNETLLEEIKSSLRISSQKFDKELMNMVQASKIDLQISGIVKIEEDDPLIQMAITLYCKCNFGLDNKDSEKYQKSFDLLKMQLSLVEEYRGL